MLDQLRQALRGSGRHRAVDRIAELDAENARLRQQVGYRLGQLAAADQLIVKVCGEKNLLQERIHRLTAEYELLATAHELLELENDELAARLTEARADLVNLRTIRSPAPADCGPAIPLPPYDPEATEELVVTTLWDGCGLRPLTQKTAA